jgi:hypothetical protein
MTQPATTSSLISQKIKKSAFLFSEGFSYFQGNREVMRSELGGKGAGLAEMTHVQINVPPGLLFLLRFVENIISKAVSYLKI